MLETGLSAVAHCINPDCHRPVVRSLTEEFCPTCRTPLHLSYRYIPVQQLSSNRHTATYRVYDQHARTEVVMKVLIDPTPVARDFFHRTPRVLSSMRCPGLPKVPVNSDFQVSLRGGVQTLSCFVMEWVRGKSLLEVSDEFPSGCPEAWVMTWLKQMLDTVQFLHGRQLIHGNLIPENVLLRDDRDQVVLIGFGNPKSLGLGNSWVGEGKASMAANGYRSRDLVAGILPTAADDLFAIGRIAIHLLTGVHPLDLEDERTGNLRWQHRAQVSSRFADLLEQLTQPQRELRYQSAADVKALLVPLMTPKEKPTFFQWWQRSPAAPSSGSSRPRTKKPPSPVLMMQDVSIPTMELPAIADGAMGLMQTVLSLAIVCGMAAAVSFWVLVSSPMAAGLQHSLVAVSQSLPVPLTPMLALFIGMGMVTAWGMLNLASDRFRFFWLTILLGGLGYGVGWMTWQGSPAPLPTLALARMGTIAAVCVAASLCSTRHWLIQLLVTGFGTAMTMTILVRSQILSASSLMALFSENESVLLPFAASSAVPVVLFFASLGAAICLWFRLSEQVAIPILRGLRGKRV